MDLPPELILEIAKIAINSEIQHPDVVSGSGSGSVRKDVDVTSPPLPLVLSQVCHRWRVVICGDLSLWTNLALGPKSSNTFNVQQYLDKSRMISIKLDIILPDNGPCEAFMQDMANIIFPHYFNRFREVSVYCESGSIDCPYFQTLGLAVFD